MAKKKQRAEAESAEKQLKGTVKKLKSQLAAAEKSAEKWKARAKEQQSKAAGTKSELTARTQAARQGRGARREVEGPRTGGPCGRGTRATSGGGRTLDHAGRHLDGDRAPSRGPDPRTSGLLAQDQGPAARGPVELGRI